MKKSDASRITIKDIAKELNLSTATISRVLSNHHAISESTKKLVNDKVKEMGFALDPIASSFRSKKTKSIGVICPRIDIDFHSKVISGIEDYAYNQGYQITIFQSQDSYKKEKEIVKMLETSLAAGIIICPALETNRYDHLKKIDKSNIPLVLYDRNTDSLKASKVVINDFEASYTATQHLIQQGCKTIAHISGNQNVDIFKSRMEGFKQALTDHQLTVHKELIKETRNLSYDEGKVQAEALLEEKIMPDGIVCANDYTAVATMKAFRNKGYKIPEEVAIVGFSNYPISAIMEPQISTIDDSAYDMGRVAAKILIQQIEDKDMQALDYQEVVIKTKLIIRDSSDKGIK
ncbi:LacI family DNA-binding transcriptional regulator [Sphingobacterium spiritivorum]|uniref:LacI family DNA-binding transcriptional regulator n=1 Tax=Sphingobacterium spiritivorum TaxID=258 RepID=UPI003DA58A59